MRKFELPKIHIDAEAPHILISAGTIGGKSVTVRNIVPACECGWVGKLSGWAIRPQAATEYHQHKQEKISA